MSERIDEEATYRGWGLETFRIWDFMISKDNGDEYAILINTTQEQIYEVVPVRNFYDHLTEVKSPPCPACDVTGSVSSNSLSQCTNSDCGVKEYYEELIEVGNDE